MSKIKSRLTVNLITDSGVPKLLPDVVGIDLKEMVGRVGFEPTTIGLKDSCLIYQAFINQSLTVSVHLQCASKLQ